MVRRCLLIAALLLLGGCGYHLPGQHNALPEDVRSVYIEAFANRTREPFVENRVANSVITEFARADYLSVTEERLGADATLSGTVVGYSLSVVAYDAVDEIAEYRSAVSVEATLRRQDTGRVLWKGTVEWSEEFLADPDKSVEEDNEARAIEEISERIAEQLLARILDDF